MSEIDAKIKLIVLEDVAAKLILNQCNRLSLFLNKSFDAADPMSSLDKLISQVLANCNIR